MVDASYCARLFHAYGSAHNVPLNLKRLAAVNSGLRKEALWNLIMTSYQQGTIYPAIAAALLFLLKLVAIPAVPNQLNIMQLLSDIVQECQFDNHKFPQKGKKKPHDNDPVIREEANFILKQLPIRS